MELRDTVRLTRLGQQLHDELRPAHQRIQQAVDQAAAEARGATGTLRAGYTTSRRRLRRRSSTCFVNSPTRKHFGRNAHHSVAGRPHFIMGIELVREHKFGVRAAPSGYPDSGLWFTAIDGSVTQFDADLNIVRQLRHPQPGWLGDVSFHGPTNQIAIACRD